MNRHLFLTGAKGVGKSTLLRKLLPHGGIGGFYTVKAQLHSDRPSVHLLQPGESPAPENLLFYCGAQQDPSVANRFDRLGCAALSHSSDIIVMDELGPAESEAYAFQAAVLRTLDGDKSVVGVLQQCDSAFVRTIADRADVRLVTVTAANRDALLPALSVFFNHHNRQTE